MGGEGSFGVATKLATWGGYETGLRGQGEVSLIGLWGWRARGARPVGATHWWDASIRKRMLRFLHDPGCMERNRENLGM